MQALCKSVAENDWFRELILALILLNAVCLGMEATPELAKKYANGLLWVFVVSQIIFVVEISTRVIACWPRLTDFFKDSWNCFDFIIVALSLVPAVGSFALVARLLRVLRVLRVLSASGTLRELFSARTSISQTLLLTGVLLVLTSYIFAVSAFYLLGPIAPDAWGTFARSLVSLGDLLILHDLATLTLPAYDESLYLLGYFVLFYLVVLGLALNLVRALLLSRSPGESEA